jgi:hypothetical protein
VELNFMTALDKVTITLTLFLARFSPILSKIVVDGAYLRAAIGSFAAIPSVAAIILAVSSIDASGDRILTPLWPVLLAIVVIGVFDAFAGFLGTAVYVIGSIVAHLASGHEMTAGDTRLLLGVVVAGFGPALLANQFRQFRRVPKNDGSYGWERVVDLFVIPFFGGWTAASMIGTLPALAGLTLAVANHVSDFSLAVAASLAIRVLLEEVIARWVPNRLDRLHPTTVPSTYPGHRYVALVMRTAIFIYVTAALLGNVWQVWVGSALFALPTILSWFQDKLPNVPVIWRILPTGVPGLALVLLVAQLTSNIVGGWFVGSPDAALWSFALLPVPLLGLSFLGALGREGAPDEVRFMKRPAMKWVYRVGGIVMLVVTMKLAGVL